MNRRNDRFALIRSRERIFRKPLLKRIYEGWYDTIAANLPLCEGPVLEFGCGAGFLGERISGHVATDLVKTPWVSCVADGTAFPFKTGTSRAIVLVNVLHHLHKPVHFFAETERCLQKGGAVLLIEPWVTHWSRFIFTFLHHEPFDSRDTKWEHRRAGPLSGVNSALPWIIFQRDRERFETLFRTLRIERIDPFMPFMYLFSGGLTPFTFAPSRAFGPLESLERRFSGVMKSWAMFAFIKIVKTG
ncbi:MAG: methyltransferase domain-containing protein [Chitinispirillaceae bacterium]|nr:methyltransferase domain-containing protein [Chitinispirillaceae bacterium]